MHQHSEILIRRLQSIAPVSAEVREALEDLRYTMRRVSRGQDIIREGDVPKECVLLLSGFLSSYKVLGDGRKQIVGFHIPGDMPDLQSYFIKKVDFYLTATTESVVAAIAHKDIGKLLKSVPALVELLWRDTLITASTFRTWVIATGRMSAAEHCAHIICELYTRYQAVGLAQEASFAIPITQEQLAYALGLSAVHANRTVQQLRGDGLIRMEGGQVTILELERLQSFAQFDPTYLHLRDHDAAA